MYDVHRKHRPKSLELSLSIIYFIIESNIIRDLNKAKCKSKHKIRLLLNV